jgi:cytochrome c oxidase subunit 4
VFAVLMALLAVTVVAAFIDFDRFLPGTGWSAAIALTIAVIKGVLIILFFMHIRYSQWITWAFASAAFVWLGIMFVLTMSEYLSRNEPPGTTPRGEPRYVQTPPPPPPPPVR